MAKRKGLIGGLTQARNIAWRAQWVLGNVIPVVELDARKIVRRALRRVALNVELRAGGGQLASVVALVARGLLGLNNRR